MIRPRQPFRRLLRWLSLDSRLRKRTGKRLSLTDRFYAARHSRWPWFLVVGLGLLLFGAVFTFAAGPAYVYFLVTRVSPLTLIGTQPVPGPLVANGGIWTFLLALLAAPIAWYLWLIRDRNRLAEFTNTRLGELRKHFYELQEWATDITNPARQSTALLQLRDFLRQDPRLVPDELRVDRERFAKQAQEFFEMLLKNRELWEKTVEASAAPAKVEGPANEANGQSSPAVSTGTKKRAKRSPVQATLEAILISDGFRLRDLQRAQMAGFRLAGSRMVAVNFTEANLSRANLSRAKFSGANLSGANLGEAIFSGAKLQNAIFNSANLIEANLSGANLTGARCFDADFANAILIDTKLIQAYLTNARFFAAILSGADFSRAVLHGTNFSDANLKGSHFDHAEITGSFINHRWKPAITGYTGTPIWLDDKTRKPLDPQPTD